MPPGPSHTVAALVIVLWCGAATLGFAQQGPADDAGDDASGGNCTIANGSAWNSSSPSSNITNGTNCTGNATNATDVPTSTTATPPAFTTPAPTLIPTAPPVTLTQCGRARFLCDDAMWRCVRGQPRRRCACLAEYWQCLTERTCGVSEDDERVCADRSSGLLCPEVDVETGLRVCPRGAGEVFDESGTGWIAALSIFCIMLVVVAATAAYIAAVRGRLRWGDGSLIFRGPPPVETAVKRAALRHFPNSPVARRYAAELERASPKGRQVQQRGGADEQHSPRATADVPDAEPPDYILITPDAVERYRAHLRDRYRKARERGEHVGEEPAYHYSPDAFRSPHRRGSGDAFGARVDSIARSSDLGSHRDTPPPDSRDERGRWPSTSHDLLDDAHAQDVLATRALEIDAANREIDAHRARLASMIEAERERLVREISVGRQLAWEGLPSEHVVTADGIAPRPPLRESLVSAPSSASPSPPRAAVGVDFDATLGGGRFGALDPPRGGAGVSRHGGFAQPAGTAADDEANPIAQLFGRRPQPGSGAARSPDRPIPANASPPRRVPTATAAPNDHPLFAFFGSSPQAHAPRRGVNDAEL